MAHDRGKSYKGTSARKRIGRRRPGYGTYRRGLDSKIHLAVDAHGMPVGLFVTAGAAADCTQACRLIEKIEAEYLLAERGYDRDLYSFRHLAENAFLKLKRWRGTAARYVKYTSSFVAAAQIRCIALWAEIFSLNYCRQYLA